MWRHLIQVLELSETMSRDRTVIRFQNQSLLKDLKNQEFLLCWHMQWITGKEWENGQLRYVKISLDFQETTWHVYWILFSIIIIIIIIVYFIIPHTTVRTVFWWPLVRNKMLRSREKRDASCQKRDWESCPESFTTVVIENFLLDFSQVIVISQVTAEKGVCGYD